MHSGTLPTGNIGKTLSTSCFFVPLVLPDPYAHEKQFLPPMDRKEEYNINNLGNK